MKMSLNQYEEKVKSMSNRELKEELLDVSGSNAFISLKGICSGTLFGCGFGVIISSLRMSVDTLPTEDFIKIYGALGVLVFGAGIATSILTAIKEDKKNQKLEILSKYVDSEEVNKKNKRKSKNLSK